MLVFLGIWCNKFTNSLPIKVQYWYFLVLGMTTVTNSMPIKVQCWYFLVYIMARFTNNEPINFQYWIIFLKFTNNLPTTSKQLPTFVNLPMISHCWDIIF